MNKLMHSILAFVSLTAQAVAFEMPVSDRGYSLQLPSLDKEMSLVSLELDENYLTRYIRRVNSKVSVTEATLISQSILKASSCFGIDPWFLTGLVQQESTFNRNAVSPTLATGLTQFTRVGIQEVNDQLGINGTAAARPAAINYFNSKIKECIDPNWVQIWDQIDLDPTSRDFFEAVKVRMKQDVDFAITYGAILLKTYIAFVDNRNIRNEKGYEDYEVLYHSLQMYNGEPGDAKVRYANKVFNHVKKAYPESLSFPKIGH